MKDCYLGIEAGKTATKAALIADDGGLLYSFCRNNDQGPIGTAITAIKEAYAKLPPGARIARVCSTGDNEYLLKNAFMLDSNVVHTVANNYAAAFINPDAGLSRIFLAFGAALVAREEAKSFSGQTTMLPLARIETLSFSTEISHCKGCANNCKLTVTRFSGNRQHIVGNRCERGLGLSKTQNDVPNLFKYKLERYFDYIPLTLDKACRGTVGIPRVLNIFEYYPFFHTFFTALSYRVILSPSSTSQIYELGKDTLSPDSPCYPIRLLSGHIKWLINQKADFIFYPSLFDGQNEIPTAGNHSHCPLITSSSENIKNNLPEISQGDVIFKNPFFSFKDINTVTMALATALAKEFPDILPREIIRAAKLAWAEQNKANEDLKNKGKEALDYLENNGKRGIVLAGFPYHLDPALNHGIPRLINSYGYAVLTADSVSHLKESKRPHTAPLVASHIASDHWLYASRLYAAASFVVERDDLELVELSSAGCGLSAVTTGQLAAILESGGKTYNCLKIDEAYDDDAVRIKLRSLFTMGEKGKTANASGDHASGEHASSEQSPGEQPSDSYPIFTPDMKATHTILAPQFSPTHFNLIEPAFSAFGYNLVFLPSDHQRAVEVGRKFLNDEACYPALLVVGQIMDALLSGAYDPERTAVMMVKTNGGCQATNYLGFIRRALLKAGMPNVPVVAFNIPGFENPAGLKLSTKLLMRIGYALTFGDLFTRCVHRMRPYEELTGSVNELHSIWRTKCQTFLRKKHLGFLGFLKFRSLCRKIVKSFDKIKITDEVKPRLGIVSEIMLNYSSASNNSLAAIKEAEGFEIQVPDLVDFLLYCFYNQIYKAKNLGTRGKTALLCRLLIHMAEFIRGAANKALDNSNHFTKSAGIFQTAEWAKPLVSLGNQAGGGWFLVGEMIAFLEDGADNVVYIKPPGSPGCLSGHLIGTGIIKELSKRYPTASIKSDCP
ncbi:MAG: acyl-CoA dehydratase activase-related protein [Lachnospiraceae bacterium]|nr:acyl-CoA dehydratase activase-related protein [Lachnospiraceae bacterium]